MNARAWALAIVALAGANATDAHHSISMFELASPVWIRGTVVSYEPVNPHAMILLEERAEDGSQRRWLIEGPALQRLARMNLPADFIEPGDVIEVCGFPPKAEFSNQRPSPGSRGYPPQTVHGHVLRSPDGQMRLWGPYGKLENCVRPGERAQMWADFVNTDPRARVAWCAGPSFMRFESLPPQAFVDEVNRLLANPCE